MVRSISLRQIEAFRAFMATGSVGRASENMNVSQPAVSKLLSNFEADTGVHIFIRKAGRLFPTRQAYQIHAEIEKVFTGTRQIELAIEKIRRAEQENIAIGIMPALADSFATTAISRFMAKHPKVHLSVVVRNSSNIVDQVASRNLDFGLINWTSTGPVLSTLPFMRRDLVCIMPIDHPLASKDIVTADDLSGLRFIAFHPANNTRSVVDAVLSAHNVTPNFVAEVTTSRTICMMVAAGLGISIIHPIHLQEPLENVAMRKFYPATPLQLMICYRNDPSESTALISSFIDVISSI